MKSSYIFHHYGSLLQSLVRVTNPQCCVECGVLEGFSTVVIGHTLKKLGQGKLYAYDLFEDYEYTHAKYRDVEKRMQKFELEDVVELRRKDIFEAAGDFGCSSVDFLHIDVSNTGDILRQVMDVWNPKIRPGGLVIFEGGSPLRDEVDWMNRYGKEKLFPEAGSNVVLNEQYSTLMLHPYPSMLICCKHILYTEANWQSFGYADLTQGAVHGEISDDILLQILKHENPWFLK